MLKDTLSSILGLTTAFLLLGGIVLGVSMANKVEASDISKTAIDEVSIETTEPLKEAEVITEDRTEVPVVESSGDIPIAENYDEIISIPEEVEYRQEIADEIAEQLPKEYINPNAVAGREHILTEADFDDYDCYMEWYIANQDRPFDIDGYFTDVPDYEPIIDPNANIIVVEGIAFDHEGNLMQESEALEAMTECEHTEEQ